MFKNIIEKNNEDEKTKEFLYESYKISSNFNEGIKYFEDFSKKTY